MTDPLVLQAGSARLEVLPDVGARIRSLVVGGRELLVTEGYGPVMWGCYPMAPWAGRIRRGRLGFAGGDHQLAVNDPPHALHGTVFDRPWAVVGPETLSIDLGPGWPFRGRVTQRIALGPSWMRAEMILEADEPMPAVVGWHPWFRRRLEGAGGSEPSPEARLHFQPALMYRRDADEGIATPELVPPGPPPWDDCFIRPAAPPVVEWPGVLLLRIESDLDHWVIYSEPEHAVCVEPQSGPPDGPNIAPRVVEPGAPLTASMTWRWWAPGEPDGSS